jgi:hypothetical protein
MSDAKRKAGREESGTAPKVPKHASDKPDTGIVEAGKDAEAFRNYEDSSRQSTVERHYSLMRTNQTFEYVMRMQKKYNSFDKTELTIKEAFGALDTYVDSSDPDSEFPNIEHSFQVNYGVPPFGTGIPPAHNLQARVRPPRPSAQQPCRTGSRCGRALRPRTAPLPPAPNRYGRILLCYSVWRRRG